MGDTRTQAAREEKQSDSTSSDQGAFLVMMAKYGALLQDIPENQKLLPSCTK